MVNIHIVLYTVYPVYSELLLTITVLWLGCDIMLFNFLTNTVTVTLTVTNLSLKGHHVRVVIRSIWWSVGEWAAGAQSVSLARVEQHEGGLHPHPSRHPHRLQHWPVRLCAYSYLQVRIHIMQVWHAHCLHHRPVRLCAYPYLQVRIHIIHVWHPHCPQHRPLRLCILLSPCKDTHHTDLYDICSLHSLQYWLIWLTSNWLQNKSCKCRLFVCFVFVFGDWCFFVNIHNTGFSTW